MKITDFKKEDLETGGLIRRKVWDSGISLSFNKGTISGEKKLTVDDITSDDWELIGKSNQVWKPEEGETYFYISSVGDVESETYDSDTYIDNARLEFTNIFRTEEEANIMARKLQIIAKLRELSNVITQKYKGELYSITYNKHTKQLFADVHANYIELPFNVYFASEELARKAIETIGEDNLKKYYFDVEEEE